MKKFLAIAFLSTLTGFSFASTPAPASAAAQAPAAVVEVSPMIEQASEAEEMKIKSAKDCASSCSSAGCSSSQFIAPASCTCSGCFH